MCILTLSTTLSETFLILRRIERGIITKFVYSCEAPVILVRL